MSTQGLGNGLSLPSLDLSTLFRDEIKKYTERVYEAAKVLELFMKKCENLEDSLFALEAFSLKV